MYKTILDLLKNMLSLITHLGDSNQIEQVSVKSCNCHADDTKIPHLLIGVALFVFVIVLPMWLLRAGNDK
jgi:hypothetical protein